MTGPARMPAVRSPSRLAAGATLGLPHHNAVVLGTPHSDAGPLTPRSPSGSGLRNSDSPVSRLPYPVLLSNIEQWTLNIWTL